MKKLREKMKKCDKEQIRDELANLSYDEMKSRYQSAKDEAKADFQCSVIFIAFTALLAILMCSIIILGNAHIFAIVVTVLIWAGLVTGAVYVSILNCDKSNTVLKILVQGITYYADDANELKMTDDEIVQEAIIIEEVAEEKPKTKTRKKTTEE